MAKWAIITVSLYIILVAVLVVPVAWWLMDKASFGSNQLELKDVVEAITHWQAWLVISVVLLAQLLMLVFPVRQYSANPVPQRAIWVPLLTAGVLMVVLLASLTGAILVAIRGDDIGNVEYWIWIPSIVVGSWVVWAAIFFSFARATDMPSFAGRLSKWLVKGSIVELLVAVPCHIVVRHRNDCCAPGVTFFGIAAGLVVMAIAFGPSVLVLADTRIKQMQSKRQRQAG